MASFSYQLLKDYTPNSLPPIIPTNSITISTNDIIDNAGVIETDAGISQYEIDYTYVAFNEIIRRALEANADVIYNPHFQNFLQWVMEYRRVLDDTRTSSNHEARIPFGNTMMQFTCASNPSTNQGGNHSFTNILGDAIRNAVSAGLDPRTYVDAATLNAAPYNLPSAYTEKCLQPGTMNFMNMVIRPTIDAMNAFTANPALPTRTTDNRAFDEFNSRLSQALAETNDQVTNGDYNVRYLILETLLRNSVNLLESLASASNTEINIIEQTADIDNYYEKLDFKYNDLTVIKPKSKVDLVTKDVIAADLQNALRRYGKMTTSNVIASTYNISAGIQNIRNVSAIVGNMLKVMSTATNIVDPPQELLDLVFTKIYIDKDQKQRAQYLNKAQLEQQTKDEIDRQNEYLNLIDNPTAQNVPPAGQATSRLERYRTEYLPQIYGGAKDLVTKYDEKTYRFSDKLSKDFSFAQSGGKTISIEDLIRRNSKSISDVNNLEDNFNENKRLYQTKNEAYFENVNFVDIDNLEQRNDYLIEMMNIIILYNFLIGNSSTDYNLFFNQLKDKMNTFKRDLTDMWNIMNARTVPINAEPVLSRFLANGAVTINEIQSILTSMGINADVPDDRYDAIINSAQTIKLIRGLQQAQGFSDTDITSILRDIHRIFAVKPQAIVNPSTISAQDIYRELYSFYTTLKSLNNSLLTNYQNLSTNITDLTQIREFTGEIIERNIDTANTFISEMITVMQNYSLYADNLQTIRREISRTKSRFSEFESYMKQTKAKLISKQNIIDNAHADIVNLAVTTHNISRADLLTFYSDYVDNYSNKITDASSNVIKYYSYEKDIRYVDERMDLVRRRNNEIFVLRDFVYDPPGDVNGIPTALRNLYVDTPIDLTGSTNFGPLSVTIFNRFNILNQRILRVFPNLMNRVDIGSELSNILDIFWCPVPSVLKAIITRFFVFTGTPQTLQNNGLSEYENQILEKQLVYYFLKYVSLAREYRLIRNRNLHTDDNNRYNRIIRTINERQSTYLTTPNNANLTNLLVYLNQFNDVPFNGMEITNRISQILRKNYDLRGYAANFDPVDANKISDTIATQFNRMVSNIFDIYYDSLSEMYNLFASLSLINTPRSTYFSQFRDQQRDLIALGSQPRMIRNLSNFQKVNNTSELLRPRQGYAVPGDRFVPRTFPYNKIHSKMNTKDNIRTYTLLNSANRTTFNNIRGAYDDFERSSLPLLAYMNELLNSGTNITNGPNNISLTYSILSGNNKQLFTNPFVYSTNGINDANAQIRFFIAFDTYLLTSNNVTNLAANNYFGGTIPVFYIPSYDEDTIDSSVNPVRYSRKDTNAAIRKYSIEITNQPINFTLGGGQNLTIDQVNYLRKIISTGRYLIDFIDRLYPLIAIIADLNVESRATWGFPTTDTNPLFAERQDKKNRLLNVLSVLRNIEETIRSNSGNYFALDDVILYENNLVITNAINSVTYIRPDDARFNDTVDRIWIFARKLLNSWYCIFAHMLTSFILNGSINRIIEVINVMNNQRDPVTLNIVSLFDPNVFNLQSFRQFVASLDNNRIIIENEITRKRNELSIEQSKYPISITSGPNQIKDPAIISFDQYYRNIGNSTDIYFIMAIIRGDNFQNLQPEFREIEHLCESFVPFINLLEDFLDPKFIRDIITNLPEITDNDLNEERLENIFTNYFDYFIDQLTIQFNGVNLSTEFEPSAQKIRQLAQRIVNYIRTETNSTIDPRTIGNRMITDTLTRDILELPHPNEEEDYQYLLDDYFNNGNIVDFIRLFITDTYIIVFTDVLAIINSYMDKINTQISIISVGKLFRFYEIFRNYFSTKRVEKLYPSTDNPYERIKYPGNANDRNVKFILFDGRQYKNSRILIDDIDNTISLTLENVKLNLSDYYDNETDNYSTLIDLDYRQRKFINKMKNDIIVRNQKLRNMINIMSQVMFNEYFRRSAFVSNTKLLEHLGITIGNFETTITMIQSKIYGIVSRNNTHVLTLSQINNYQAFKSTINKTINGENIIVNFYRTMSFGIAEFYKDILSAILDCLEDKDFDQMSEIEAYLYQYHYIQLKRCDALFKWINEDYLKNQQAQEFTKLQQNIPFERILSKRIDTLNTKGDVNSVIVEFHGLRKFLDDYNAVVMDPVQIHMRINDFKETQTIKDYNEKVRSDARRKGITDIESVIDYDVSSTRYLDKWDHDNLIFMNKNDGKILKVNFDVMDKIYRFDNAQNKPFNLYYNDLYSKMKPNFVGVQFDRIYNTLQYPDSDVIANYMSIAPNILNNKGTVIMTYGYSGVGKSVSLFGRPASEGDPGSNGILQATLGYFSNVEIYFRVYEIYGLGTQYNYYWNPQNPDDSYKCYPDFYQCIIHHVLDASGSTLASVDRLVFTNRHDMLAYIMDLRDPARTNATGGFTVNSRGRGGPNDSDPNLAGARGYATYFNANNKSIRSTYTRINEAQYNNFSGFVDSIEGNRKAGITIHRLFDHIISQVKGTINNKDSSRSILVYDFEININPQAISNKIYIPFLIYDLPGKEDIYRTYVQTGLQDAVGDAKRRVFHDLNNDPGKGEKSSFVLNPILIPIFRNNIIQIMNILKAISGPPGLNGKIMDAGKQTEIVQAIINYQITNFTWSNSGQQTPEGYDIFKYNPDGASYRLADLYTQTPPGNIINTFVALFNVDNLDQNRITADPVTIVTDIAVPYGIIGLMAPNVNDRDKIANEIFILVAVITVAFLIKYGYFDIVVEIIHAIIEGDNDSPEKGGWTRNKIYAFFEAYYINENVIGLLEYLVKNVLNRTDTGIPPQSTIDEIMTQTVNKNYSVANKYRNIENNTLNDEEGVVDNDYNLNVTPELINKDLPINNDPIRLQEIDQFTTDNGVNTLDPNDPETYGVFAVQEDPLLPTYRKMNNVLTFENRGLYNSNRIFRNGSKTNCQDSAAIHDPDASLLFDPSSAGSTIRTIRETNRPLLQDFIEPYEQKISFYYVFFVVSNNQPRLKAEEQIKLINNSMPFINKLDPASKKKTCAQ